MAKVTINNISSGYLSTASINANFQVLEAELNDKVLYRTNPAGEPNVMNNDLDMNSKRILNLAAPALASEAVTKSYVDNFISGSATFAGIQQESQVAVAGQTLVTLSAITYVTGANELAVYINGVRQVSFTETSSTSITVGGAMDVGDVVFIERRQIAV